MKEKFCFGNKKGQGVYCEEEIKKINREKIKSKIKGGRKN